MTEKVQPEVKYIGFQSRLMATAIDLVLSSVVLLPFSQGGMPPQLQEMFIRHSRGEISDQELMALANHYLLYQGGLANYMADQFTYFIFAGFVVVLFWIYRAATPGKMLLKMKIVDTKTGGQPTSTQLILRYIGYIISGVPLGLGFVWMSFNKKRRAWHDYLAGTVVISTKKPKPEVSEGKKE